MYFICSLAGQISFIYFTILLRRHLAQIEKEDPSDHASSLLTWEDRYVPDKNLCV